MFSFPSVFSSNYSLPCNKLQLYKYPCFVFCDVKWMNWIGLDHRHARMESTCRYFQIIYIWQLSNQTNRQYVWHLPNLLCDTISYMRAHISSRSSMYQVFSCVASERMREHKHLVQAVHSACDTHICVAGDVLFSVFSVYQKYPKDTLLKLWYLPKSMKTWIACGQD